MNELQEEEEKLRKIINIVRPTTLPELTKPQVQETLLKVEHLQKVNPIENSIKPPTKPTVPVEVKKIDKITKPVVEEKMDPDIIKKKDELKEAEGIII